MPLALPSLFLVIYIVCSLILPLPVRLLGKAVAGVVLLAISLKYAVYQWLGGAFFAPELPRPALLVMETLYAAVVILFFFLLIKDVLGLALWISRRLGTTWRLPFSPAARGVALTLAALGLGVFGTWQAVKVPGVHTVEVALPRLPQALDGFTLVQLTDLHIGPLLKRDWLRAVVEKTNALNPDAVVMTGDFIDGSPARLEQDIAPLAGLRARRGVYGVTGNHEYYYHVEQWLPVFAALGVDMLHNEHRVLPVDDTNLILVGLPDATEKRFGGEGPDLSKALAGAPDGVKVLLAHQPRGARERDAVDVQLSGHTHGGLMVFLQPIIAYFNEGFVNGLYDLGGGNLYVSPGTGLWNGFSNRVGVPSEITRIILRRPS